MNLVRFVPGRDLERFEDRMARVFGDIVPGWWREAEGLQPWEPAVDVYEDEKEFVLKAEVPEVDKKDVKVNIEGNLLTINGERKEEKEVKEKEYHRRERYFGTFTRTFTLPTTVDREHITATHKDGVMTIRLPKREEVKPREIEIKAA